MNTPPRPATASNMSPRFTGALPVSPVRRRGVPVWLGYTLAAIGVALLGWLLAYNRLDPYTYADRDDALITYSHVRHLYEEGFIGVSPSGERVEGYSNPLDFLLYTIFYGLAGPQYPVYNLLKTYLSLAAMGVVLFAGARRAMLPDGSGRQGSESGAGLWLPLLATLIAGALMSLGIPFMQWHGSGMETSLSEPLMLALLVVAVHLALGGPVRLWMALPWFAASITRAESLYHTAPLMAAAALMSGQLGRRAGWWPWIRMTALMVALYGGVLLIRYAYFGAWMPNTARAQGISISQNLWLLVNGDNGYRDETLKYLGQIVSQNMVGFWAAALVLAMARPLRGWARATLILTGTLVALMSLHPGIFHAGRLGGGRYGAHLGPVVAASLAWTLVALWQMASRDRLLKLRPRTGRLIVCLGGALGIIVATVIAARPTFEVLCCPEGYFRPEQAQYRDMAATQDWRRPMLANADLGVLSHDKELNHFDYAYLGSPVGARLQTSMTLLSEYAYEFCRPHLLEVRQPWACWRPFETDDRLSRRYTLAAPEEGGSCQVEGRGGMWVLTSLMAGAPTPERALYNALARALPHRDSARGWSQPAAPVWPTIRGAFDTYLAASGRRADATGRYAGPYTGFAAVAAAYEFWPELVGAELADSARAYLIARAPGLGGALADVWLGSGHRRAWDAPMAQLVAIGFIDRTLGPGPSPLLRAGLPMARGKALSAYARPGTRLGEAYGWDVYVGDSALVLLRDDTQPPDANRGLYVTPYIKGVAQEPYSISPIYARTSLPGGGMIIACPLPRGAGDSIEVAQREWDRDGRMQDFWLVSGRVGQGASGTGTPAPQTQSAP